ncbi:uncharacterized protein LOC126739231 [Anthonomus grandis grandis]|uniref:uncharacterized protein LOC126739231 n=1 Tax=Anthonomus grandis grandis TaxID=2921223 RepID=UPI002165F390|nr:uncharacterized protein LOC126739231 [Anthonomus grandis grandis]
MSNFIILAESEYQSTKDPWRHRSISNIPPKMFKLTLLIVVSATLAYAAPGFHYPEPIFKPLVLPSPKIVEVPVITKKIVPVVTQKVVPVVSHKVVPVVSYTKEIVPSFDSHPHHF